MRTLILVVLFQAYRVVNEPLACCYGQALRSSSMNLWLVVFVQALRSFEPWGSRDGAVMLG
jgi:hypothetical protein